ncbi:MAG: DUF3102 domain-containing protein [Candidatus Hodarchaeales archaeon]
MSIETNIELIRDLEKTARASFVKQAIEIGNHLIEIKEELGYGSWGPFVRNTFGFSLRTCQEYMKVARYSIHENHYSYGLRGLIDMINTDTDLSYPSIDRYCQTCPGYADGEDCLLIFRNQTGDCPCCKCSIQLVCSEWCINMYEWEECNDSY